MCYVDGYIVKISICVELDIYLLIHKSFRKGDHSNKITIGS